MGARALHPTPYALHLTHYTLHPTPYTLHPTHYTLHPTPYTLQLVGESTCAAEEGGGAWEQEPPIAARVQHAEHPRNLSLTEQTGQIFFPLQNPAIYGIWGVRCLWGTGLGGREKGERETRGSTRALPSSAHEPGYVRRGRVGGGTTPRRAGPACRTPAQPAYRVRTLAIRYCSQSYACKSLR